MKINYTSKVTGKRTTARVDENLWSIFLEIMKITAPASGGTDSHLSLEGWITAFDKEFRTFAGSEAPTFSAYISKRLTEEIKRDLEAIRETL